MPALGTGTGKSAAAEKKIKAKKRAAPKPKIVRSTRPAPKSQPGPYTDAEHRKVERNRSTPKYQRAIRAARKHGPASARGTSPAGDRKSEYETSKSQELEKRREARIRYLRATRPKGSELASLILRKVAGNPSSSDLLRESATGRAKPRIVKRELEGKGVLAGTLREVAKPIVKSQSKDPSRGPASRITKASSSPLGGTKLAENLAKDVVTFPSQAVTSVYVPVAGAVEAAKGHPERIKRLAKDINEGDPVYNLAAAGVEAVGGDKKAASKRLKAAAKAAEEHPGLTAFEIAGVKGGAGRTTSRVLRGGGRTVRRAGKATGSKRVERAGEKIRKAGSTERASRRVPGTAIVEERSYSRDSFTKARQVNKDRMARKKVKRLNEQAKRAAGHGHHDEANDLRAQAVKANPDRVSAAEIKRQVDEEIQLHEDIRRLHRGRTTKTTRKIIKGAKREKGALSVVTQRVARADKTDLADYVRELEAEAKGLSRSRLAANRNLRKQLQAVIDDPKANMARLETAAKAFQAHTAPTQKRLGELQVLDPKQVERAAVIPYAVRRMGARNEGDGLVRDVKAIRVRARTEEGKPTPSREEFIASRPKADPRDTPTIEKTTFTLPEKAEPGIHVERDYKRYRNTDGSVGELSDRPVPGTDRKIVARGPDGRVQGVLHVFFDEKGKPDLLEVVVDPAHRSKGIASKLYAFAEKQGWDVEAASGRGGLTEAGAALAHKRLIKKNAPRRVIERTETTETRPLSTKAIKAHMSRSGESPAAFLTQAPSMRGARNFNVRSERPPQAGPTGRTGEATRKGTFDPHPETLVEGAARGQGLVDAAEGFGAQIKRFGARKKGKDGTARTRTFQTKKQADAAARDHLHLENGDPDPHAVPMRAVRINPFGGRNAQLEKLLEDADKLTADQHNQILDSLKDAVSENPSGTGPWALIPEAAAHRILDHLNTQGGGGGLKTVQLANQTFRKTVLATSTSWLAGNTVEGSLRAALAHAGPRSYAQGLFARRDLRAIDPKMADEMMSRVLGGGHMMSVDRQSVRRGAEQFEGTAVAPIANALGKFWRTPGPKQAAQFWNGFTDVVMRQLSGRFETQVQTAMLGAALRKSPLLDQRVVKLSKRARMEAAQGLAKTDTQIRFGREVDIMYGRYAKLPPWQKKAIATYTPFISWWLNSVYFVYRTLPRDHPVVTGLIASAEMATEEWRKSHGLDQFIKGAVPGFLQGSIPLSGNRKQRAPMRYTPFGAFGDPGGTIAGQVTPLMSGPLSALQGRDWTGRELRVKGADGKTRPPDVLERFVFASHAFLQSTVPFLSTGERIKAKGPGALNPIKPVAPPKAKKKKFKVYKAGAGTGRRSSSSSAPTTGRVLNLGGSSSSSGSSGGRVLNLGGSSGSSSSGGGGRVLNIP